MDMFRDGGGASTALGKPTRYTTCMRVIIDYDLCESNALCMAAAPEVFEARDNDLLYVLQEHPPEALREKVLAAVRACPKAAISIED